jgi:3-oxoisoapionate decarboxylase
MGAAISHEGLAMLNRRDLIRGALAASALSFARSTASAADAKTRLGVCTYSYPLHWSAVKQNQGELPFRDAIGFLEYCDRLGAAGAQIVVGPWEPGYAAKLRARAEALGMYVEGQVALPHNPEEVEKFDAQLRTAREAGMDVVRSVCLSGRRYETFRAAGDWPPFVERSTAALKLAEPVVRKHRMRLAIENHKDWRVPELLDLLKRVGSEFVGVCLDTGNSIALLEEPHAVVDALAPVTSRTWRWTSRPTVSGSRRYRSATATWTCRGSSPPCGGRTRRSASTWK